MAAAIPGVGFLRLLRIGLRFDDGGISAKMARVNGQVGIMSRGFSGLGANVGMVRTQMAMLAFGGGAAIAGLSKQFADFEKAATLAGIAATAQFDETSAAIGKTTSGVNELKMAVRDARKDAVLLARDLREGPTRALRTLRQVRQFGISNPVAARNIAGGGIMLEQLTDREISAVEAAEGIHRVKQFAAMNRARRQGRTATPGEIESFAANTGSGFESAVFLTASMTTASPAQVMEMLRKVAPAGGVSGLSGAEMIAISSAVSHIDPGVRDKTSSSIMRIFTDRLPNNIGGYAQALSNFSSLGPTTAEDIMRLRKEDPATLFKAIAETFVNLTRLDDPRIMESYLESMDLGNVRDKATLATFGATIQGGLYDRLIRAAEHEIQTGMSGRDTFLDQKHVDLMKTLTYRWKRFTTELQIFAINAGEALLPVVGALTDSFARLFRVINDNQKVVAALAGALTFIPLAVAGVLLAKGWQFLKPFGTSAAMMTGGLDPLTGRVASQGANIPGILRKTPKGTHARLAALDLLNQHEAEIVSRGGAPIWITGPDGKPTAVGADAIHRQKGAIIKELEEMYQKGLLAEQAEDLNKARAFRRRLFTRPLTTMGMGLAAVTGFGAIGMPNLGVRQKMSNFFGPRAALTRGAMGSAIGRAGGAVQAGVSSTGRPLFYGPNGQLLDEAQAKKLGLKTKKSILTGGHLFYNPLTNQKITSKGAMRAALIAGTFGPNLSRIGKGAGVLGAIPGVGALLRFGLQRSPLFARMMAPIFGAAGRGAAGFGIARAFGSRMMGSAAGRMAGAAIPVVGQVASILGLLAPLFRMLGDALERLGQGQSGLLGMVVRQFTILVKTLELVGNVFNWLFDKALSGLISFVKWVGSKISGSETLQKIFGWMNKIFDSIIKWLDILNLAAREDMSISDAKRAYGTEEVLKTMETPANEFGRHVRAFGTGKKLQVDVTVNQPQMKNENHMTVVSDMRSFEEQMELAARINAYNFTRFYNTYRRTG